MTDLTPELRRALAQLMAEWQTLHHSVARLGRALDALEQEMAALEQQT